MTSTEKKTLSERDICTKFITPALVKAGWDVQTQIREEVNLTKGRVIVSGRTHRRGEAKRADYLLHYKPNLPLAIIEAKDNNHTVGAGMQQGLGLRGHPQGRSLRFQFQWRRLPVPRPHGEIGPGGKGT